MKPTVRVGLLLVILGGCNTTSNPRQAEMPAFKGSILTAKQQQPSPSAANPPVYVTLAGPDGGKTSAAQVHLSVPTAFVAPPGSPTIPASTPTLSAPPPIGATSRTPYQGISPDAMASSAPRAPGEPHHAIQAETPEPKLASPKALADDLPVLYAPEPPALSDVIGRAGQLKPAPVSPASRLGPRLADPIFIHAIPAETPASRPEKSGAILTGTIEEVKSPASPNP